MSTPRRDIVMSTVIIVIVALAVGGLGWSIKQGQTKERQQEDAAIARCREQGGEALLRYSYNRDAFYLDGCKLR